MSPTDSHHARRADRVAIDAEVALQRPELEERVWVKFEGLDALEGMVVWVGGFVAGIEFVRPMHQAVFDALTPRLG